MVIYYIYGYDMPMDLTKAVQCWSCPLSRSRDWIIPHQPCMPKWAETCENILSQLGPEPKSSRLGGSCSTI